MVSDLVIVAAIGAAGGVVAAVPSLITSLATLRQSRKNARHLEIVRHDVDGKVTKLITSMDELITLQREAAEAKIQLAAQTSFEAGKRAEAEGKRRATDRPPDDKENT